MCVWSRLGPSLVFGRVEAAPHGCHAARCSSFYSMPVPYPSSPAPSPLPPMALGGCGGTRFRRFGVEGHIVCPVPSGIVSCFRACRGRSGGVARQSSQPNSNAPRPRRHNVSRPVPDIHSVRAPSSHRRNSNPRHAYGIKATQTKRDTLFVL